MIRGFVMLDVLLAIALLSFLLIVVSDGLILWADIDKKAVDPGKALFWGQKEMEKLLQKGPQGEGKMVWGQFECYKEIEKQGEFYLARVTVKWGEGKDLVLKTYYLPDCYFRGI